MKMTMILLLSLICANAFSNSKIVDTSEASTQALIDFQDQNDTSVVNKFNGIKAWPVSGGVKVKIYVKGQDSVEYSCHRHSDNEPFECH